MKKALLVTVLVAFLALGTAFAEVTGVGDPEISGTMSLTAGWDLDAHATGFQNDNSIVVKLPLLTGSETKGADDEIYGEIEIKDIGWYLQSDGGNFEFYDADEDDDFSQVTDSETETDAFDDEMGNLDATMSATLHFYDAFVKLGNPDFEMNNVDLSDDYLVDANVYEAGDTWSDGFSLGYGTDMFSVELMVASKADAYMTSEDNDNGVEDSVTSSFDNDMDDDGDDTYNPNDQHLYVIGGKFSVMPMAGVTVPVSFSYDNQASNGNDNYLFAVGAAPSVAIAPLTFDLGLDFVLEHNAASGADDRTGFEMEPKVTYDLVPDGSNVSANMQFGTYSNVFVEKDGLDTDGDGVIDVDEGTDPYVGTEVKNNVLGFGLTFTETEENGFVPNLASSLTVSTWNLQDHLDQDPPDDYLPVDVEGDASYNISGIKPYMNAGYDLSDAVLDLGVGVELMAAATGIDNTTITLDYTNDGVMDGEAYDDEPKDVDDERGRLTLDVTVAW